MNTRQWKKKIIGKRNRRSEQQKFFYLIFRIMGFHHMKNYFWPPGRTRAIGVHPIRGFGGELERRVA
jgi:hypothetical protein